MDPRVRPSAHFLSSLEPHSECRSQAIPAVFLVIYLFLHRRAHICGYLLCFCACTIDSVLICTVFALPYTFWVLFTWFLCRRDRFCCYLHGFCLGSIDFLIIYMSFARTCAFLVWFTMFLLTSWAAGEAKRALDENLYVGPNCYPPAQTLIS